MKKEKRLRNVPYNVRAITKIYQNDHQVTFYSYYVFCGSFWRKFKETLASPGGFQKLKEKRLIFLNLNRSEDPPGARSKCLKRLRSFFFLLFLVFTVSGEIKQIKYASRFLSEKGKTTLASPGGFQKNS